MTSTEKVAYIKGLMEGLDIDLDSKEGKLFNAIVDVLEEMADTIESLEDYVDELTEQVDAIDEDLADLETDYYGELEDEEDAGSGEFYDVVCPSCNEEFCVDEDTLLEGGIECPNCGESLEFHIECDDENCECAKDDAADQEE